VFPLARVVGGGHDDGGREGVEGLQTEKVAEDEEDLVKGGDIEDLRGNGEVGLSGQV
jgi:hypothetical protein